MTSQGQLAAPVFKAPMMDADSQQMVQPWLTPAPFMGKEFKGEQRAGGERMGQRPGQGKNHLSHLIFTLMIINFGTCL